MELLKTNSIQKPLKVFLMVFFGTVALTISAKFRIIGSVLQNGRTGPVLLPKAGKIALKMQVNMMR